MSELKPLQEDIDLSAAQLAEVLWILNTQVANLQVWAFGSRVTGSAREYSDLDLALITTEPLPLSRMADLVTCFEESNLPFKVDLVDWACTSENFRKIIMVNKIVLLEGSKA